MSAPPVPIEQANAQTEASAYDSVRGDDSIQYLPIEVDKTPPEPPSEPPQWLENFLEGLGNFFEPIGQMFGSSWPIFKWFLIAGAAACLLYILWKLLSPVLDLRPKARIEDDDWVPEQGEAIALLDDADRLAADGRYDEATHLLLKRSVGQIAGARPNLVDPSSTARELALLPALSETARAAFATIAERVERSLFALRSLNADDWQAARDAYAQFALQRLSDDPA